MRLILKEKKALVTEESKANPVDVLTKIAIKCIVDQIVLNPPVEKPEVVPVGRFLRELRALQDSSPKYKKFKIGWQKEDGEKKVGKGDGLYLDYYGASRMTTKFGSSGIYVGEKDIYIYYEPHYSLQELEMYKEIKKGKGQAKETFEKELEKAKLSKNSSLNRGMTPPEYTRSKTANKENLSMYSKRLEVKPYYTEENVLSIFEGGKAKGHVYNWIMSKSRELGNAFSILAHELRHSYQFGNEAFRKQLEAFDARKLRQLELNDRFYQTNDLKKDEYDSPVAGQVMSYYYYYTSPIEIDARLTQYRKAKKQRPEKSYFDIVFEKEKTIVDSLNAAPSFRNIIDLATKEMKSKAMFLILNQISKQDKKIFESDPRFAQELQKAFAEVKETLNNSRFIKEKKFGYPS